MKWERGMVLTTATNRLLMQQLFPAFSYHWGKGVATWRGTFRRQETGQVYHVCVKMDGMTRPRVTIPSLPLDPRPPHLFPNNTLCLYHPQDPEDRRWHPGRAIAHTIMPWTAEWILFFEGWQETGVWWGPEAPHAEGNAKAG